MAVRIPPPRKWNHKHIILVTLTGALVVITMAAIISIILSPAHIFFSIENPATSGIGNKTDTTHYNFTLVAENRSPRMAVAYGALSAEIWYSETAWVPAVVDRSSLQDGTTTRQRLTNISVSADYWQSEQTSTTPTASGGESAPAGTGDDNDDDEEMDWSNCTVLIAATVWFKYGWISTRSYNVLANCSPVNFNNGTGSSVECA